MRDDEEPKLPDPSPADADDWLDLAEKASRETDGQKLIAIVSELCEKLDKRETRQPAKKPIQNHDPTKPLDSAKPSA